MKRSLCLAVLTCLALGIHADDADILTASDGEPGDYFGGAASVSGDYVVVGTYPEVASGAAYVYKKNEDDSWAQTQKIVSTDPAKFEEFSFSVDVDGSVMAVSAPGYNDSDGAVNVYDLNGETWTLTQTITQPDGADVANFGEVVAVSGSYLIIAAPYGATTSDFGKAFIYKKDPGVGWKLTRTLSPAAGTETDPSFAAWVDITPNYAIVTAPDAGSEILGEAYVYANNGDAWDLTATLTPPEGFCGFGVYAALTDQYATVTAIDQEYEIRGAVAVHRNTSGTWAWTQTLEAPSPSEGMFGYALALTNSLLAVGAPMADFKGKVHTYALIDGTWTLDETLAPSDYSFAATGSAVGYDETSKILIAGAPMALREKGVVYLWQLDSSFLTITVSPEKAGTTDPVAAVTHRVTTNEPVTIKATPATGYAFSLWEVASGTVTFEDAHSASTTATVDGVGEIIARFTPVANVAFGVFPESSGTTSPSGGVSVEKGATLTIKAIPAEGYYFSQWTDTGLVILDNPLNQNAQALINGDGTITATFAPFVKEVQLTVLTLPESGGSTVPSPGTHVVESSRSFSLEATPGSEWHFVQWLIDGSGVISDPRAATTTAAISENATITAEFAENTSAATLTMASSPTGSGTTTPAGATTVVVNQPVQIQAESADGYHFVSWSISGSGALDGADTAIAWATLTGDATVTANFEANAEQANVTFTVSPDNSGTTNPGIGTHQVNIGETYEILATATDGYFFKRWSSTGGADIVETEIADTHVIISGDAVLTANFAAMAAKTTLTLASLPDSGGSTNPGSGSLQVTTGQNIHVTALPAPGYYFTHWTSGGDVELDDPKDADTVATVNGEASVTANFERTTSTVTLTMGASPDGGGSTSPSVGSHTVGVGSFQRIKASPVVGYVFDHWVVTGGGIVNDPNAADATVVLSGDAIVAALFQKRVTDVHLTLGVDPSEAGTTNPGVGEHTVHLGERISIEATAADGYAFLVWNAQKDLDVDDPFAEKTTVQVNGSATLTAVFQPVTKTATLTLAASPDDGGSTNPGVGEHAIPVGDKISIEAVAEDGWHFTQWTLVGSKTTIDDLFDPSTHVKVGADATVTANFAVNATPVTLVMAISPDDSGETIPGVGTHANLQEGQSIEIEATAADGYHFIKWTANDGANITNPIDADTTVQLIGDAVVTANFEVDSDVAQLVIVNSDSTAGLIQPYPGVYEKRIGEIVELEAAVFNNHYFVKWDLDGEGTIDDDKSQIAHLTLAGDATVTAMFSATPPVFLSHGALPLFDATGVSERTRTLYAIIYNTKKSLNKPTKVFLNDVSFDIDSEVLSGIWNKSIRLYDKRDYPNGVKLSERLLTNPIQDLECYAVYANATGEEPRKLDVNAFVACPVVDAVDGDYAEAGDLFTVSGRFFGASLPVVFIEFTLNDKVKYAKCRLDRTASLIYQDAKGRDGKSCMKILSSDPADQSPVNHSQVIARYPKLNKNAQTTGYLILKNKNGMSAFRFPAKKKR